jgi:CheY-like chemotaxis protein
VTSRIVAGKLRLDPRPIDPAGPVFAAIEAILPGAAAKAVVVRPPAVAAGARVFADAARLQQVVWNLLTNAVKFTPQGGEVSVGIQPRAGEVDIVVRDTGAGIPEEFLPHVFDRFRQADSRTTRAHGGLGIGLSIARHLVEAQGGRVRAESGGENQGATFVVTLPLAVTEDGRHAAAAPEQRGGDGPPSWAADREALHGLRVLAVDDEADARDLTAAMLRHHGAEVMTAASVDDAIDAVCRWTPHVLVVDIAMPGADGFALLRRLRELGGAAAGIPAVALTAYAREEDRHRGLQSGFQGYLTKPVDEGALLESVALARSGRSTRHADSRT